MLPCLRMPLFNHIRLDSSARPSGGNFYSPAVFYWSAILPAGAVYTYLNSGIHSVYWVREVCTMGEREADVV